MANARYIINVLTIPGRGFRYQVLDASQSVKGKRQVPAMLASGNVDTREEAYDRIISLLRARATEGL